MSHMKFVAVLLLGAGMLWVARSGAENAPAPQIGRYQLVSGRYYHMANGGKTPIFTSG